MHDLTFLVCTGSTALHNGYGQENNVQREKHSAELTAWIHRHHAQVFKKIWFQKNKTVKTKQKSTTGLTKSLCWMCIRHTAPLVEVPALVFVKSSSAYFVNSLQLEAEKEKVVEEEAVPFCSTNLKVLKPHPSLAFKRKAWKWCGLALRRRMRHIQNSENVHSYSCSKNQSSPSSANRVSHSPWLTINSHIASNF